MTDTVTKPSLWRRLRDALPQPAEDAGDIAPEFRSPSGGREEDDEEGPHSPKPQPDPRRKKEPDKPSRPEEPEPKRRERRPPGPAPDREPPGLPEHEREHELPPTAPEPEPRTHDKGWFSRLSAGLSRSQTALGEGIAGIFTKARLDPSSLDELEDVLIRADLGPAMAMRITDALYKGRYEKGITPKEVRGVLAAEVTKVLAPVAQPFMPDFSKTPHVALIVGVNGSGKTTTIGKLAQHFAGRGRKVMLAAGDTFRAAAIEQLQIWGERTGSFVVAHKDGADPAGVAFEAYERAKAGGADLLMIDTAGRLQNRADLMSGLAKIVRVLKKQDENAPHSVILVLDATTGQNALAQVEAFRETAGVTGIILTKLDGSARGGILVAIADKFGLPVHAIGVGESADDLQPFRPDEFARVIAGSDGQAA